MEHKNSHLTAALSQDGAEQANMGVALGDYQNSGCFSIAVTHSSGIAPSTAPYVGWGDAFLDFDNDGWLDLFLVNGHVYPQVSRIFWPPTTFTM